MNAVKWLLCSMLFAGAVQALEKGDIAFVQYNCTNPDCFKFVCLVDIPGGESINFTDNGWLNEGGFRSGEGGISWTAPVEGAPAGTIVQVDQDGNCSWGTGVEFDLGFNVAAAGDQIIAYQGYAGLAKGMNGIILLTAINNSGDGWQDDATSTQTSALPTGLSSGTSVALPDIGDAIYNGAVLTGTADEVRAAINNPNNWGSGSSFDEEIIIESLDVVVADFSAVRNGETIVLSWQIQNPAVAAMHVLCRQPGHAWQTVTTAPITVIPGAVEYHYQHEQAGENIEYCIKAIFCDGRTERSESISAPAATWVQLANRPDSPQLVSAYPNPFNAAIRIRAEFPRPMYVTLAVYDLRGRYLMTLAEEIIHGAGSWVWDGRNQSGDRVPSGGYIVRLETESKIITQKVLLIR